MSHANKIFLALTHSHDVGKEMMKMGEGDKEGCDILGMGVEMKGIGDGHGLFNVFSMFF